MPDNTRKGRTRDEYAPTDPKYVVVPGQGRPGGPSTPSGPTLAQFLSNIATGAAKKIGETVGQTATGVATGVAGIGLPQSANAVGVTPAVGAGYAALLGKTAEKAAVETAGVYDKYIWEPWTHAETSLLGTVATLEQGKGWDDPKAIWDKAWQASDRALQPNPLTPGQAAVSVLQNLPVIKQIFEPPPQYTVDNLFDPAERDARNRRLGKAGEEFVLSVERRRLQNSGCEQLADRIEQVLTRPAVSDGLRTKAAALLAEHYSWDAIAASTIDVYHAALGNRAK